MLQVAIILTTLLFVVIVLLVGGLVVRRLFITRDEQRERALFDELRPLMVGWLGEPDQPPPAGLIGITDRQRRDVVSQLLARYGTMLRGEARDRISSYVAEQGFVEAAVRDLRSWRSWRRGRAARTLGDFGSSRGVRHLAQRVTQDRDPAVRLAATRALGRIDDYKSAAALLIVLPTGTVPAGVVAQSLLELGPHAFRALISACDDEDVVVRRIACRLVGLAGAGSSPEGMRSGRDALHRRAIEDPDTQVRAAALGSLARLGDTTSSDAVRIALDLYDPRVRLAAADAARALWLTDVAPRLLAVVGEEVSAARPMWNVARHAAHAWATLADELDPGALDARSLERALPLLHEAADAQHRELAT